MITHAGHDPEVVASLLDGDLVGADRATAARQVAGCSNCAALHRDLLVLASATRELRTPARTLDFRLTAADAERLREPLAASARLEVDMQTASSHPSHDTMLVASLADHALADHGLAAPELEAAEALVAACSLCAALHADLVALSAATRSMHSPTRPRDYTLTPDDAARLRATGWRRWVAGFGTSRDVFSRPLALGLTTLGLAGLLVATVPSVLQGQAATSSGASSGFVDSAAPALGALPEAASRVPDPRAAAAASSANGLQPTAASSELGQGSPTVGGPILADGASPGPVTGAVRSGSAKGADAGSPPTDLSVSPETTVAKVPSGPSMLLVLSGALLVVGLGLFLIRRTARRISD